ncbi:DNA glycosylase AlkZ-like family protein [Solicola gregarius]|uniref:Winged helix DNA-binding domain-containing protein n=1 Tax=Solicola gregarius TaxID=2908642 RepID=A0AA46YN57_9ACTN|nr:crosslink repair DNA glycosylase YcaQ family protein [Solicola gregarius]UYM06403.1 winged helix DNA-binding domain-containing protein [Solicola gregarius]
MAAHELSRTDARRIAVRAQLLDAARPADLHEMVRRLSLLQVDQTSAIAPNADLSSWSRLGSTYAPGDLERALADGSMVELRGFIRPAQDLALYRADMAAWPGSGDVAEWMLAQRDWIDDNDACHRDITARLELSGPLTARDIPDTCIVPWRSTGWNNNRNVRMMLDLMEQRGEIATAGHKGRDRLWDLAVRVYPDDAVVPAPEARLLRDETRLRALGIARGKTTACPVEPNDVGTAGEPAVIDGVRGEWRVDPAQLGQPFSGRAALLSPLDRLVYDRSRMAELFDFDYQLEMYKPAAKRRWGYFALPILYGDRLVGKVDATADRKARVLRVDAIHRDVRFTKTMTAAIDHEIRDLADWLELDLDLPG